MKVELSHDMIAKQVLEKASVSAKARRQIKALVERGLERYKEKNIPLTSDDLDEIRPYENTVNFTEEELSLLTESKRHLRKAMLRKRGMVIGIIAILSVATIISIFFANRASENAIEANIERANAQNLAVVSAKIARKALANDLIFKAKSESDRTLSFRIAQLASLIEPENPEIVPLLVDLTNWSNPDPIHSNFFGHDGSVMGVAFSPDGKTAATAAEDNLAILWDIKTGKEKILLGGHTEKVRAVAFNSTGEIIATGSKDGSIKLWDTGSGDLIKTFDPGMGYIRSVVFFKMDSIIVGGTENGMVLYSVDSGDQVQPEYGNHPGEVIEIISEPKSGNLVSFGSNGMAIRWMTDPDTLIMEDRDGNPIPIWSGSVNTRNDKLALGLQRDYTIVKDLSQFDFSSTSLPHPGFIYSVDFLGEKLVTACQDSRLRIWNVDKKEIEFELTAHSKKIVTTAVSGNNKYILSGGEDKVAKYWQFPEPYFGLLLEKMAQKIEVDGDEFMPSIFTSSLSPDGKYLAGSIQYFKKSNYRLDSKKGKLMIWDISSGKMIAESELFKEPPVDIQFNSRGNKILFSTDNNLRIFDFSNGILQEDSKALKNIPKGSSIACSSDGSKYAVSSELGSLYLNVSGVEKTIPVSNQRNGISKIAISNKSDWIVAGEWNGTVKLITLADSNIEEINPGNIRLISTLAISPNDSMLAVATLNNEIFIWSLNSKSNLFKFQDHSSAILSLQFDLDGKWLVSSGEDRTVKLWDTQSGKLLFTLEDFPSIPHSVYFHPKENKILIVTTQSVFSLSLDPDELIEEFENKHRPAHLTVDDLDRYQLDDGLVFDPEILKKFIQNRDEEQLYFLAEYFDLLGMRKSNDWYISKSIEIYLVLEEIAKLRNPAFYNNKIKNF